MNHAGVGSLRDLKPWGREVFRCARVAAAAAVVVADLLVTAPEKNKAMFVCGRASGCGSVEDTRKVFMFVI